MQAARTTWFTVVRKTEATNFASASRALPNATVRRGDVAPFQGVRGPSKGVAVRDPFSAPKIIERAILAIDLAV